MMMMGTPMMSSTAVTQSAIDRLRGGGSTEDYIRFIDGAYEWCCNLGAPSALVAGAVIATLYENMHSGDLEVLQSDSLATQLGKKVTRLLLLSAFAMEAISIFVTTVTGTMLLSRPVEQLRFASDPVFTPLEFLRSNFEFEYLTARITFLQGLLNWLAAIGLGHLFANPTDSPSTVALNKFIACSLGAVIVVMVSFYNAHITYYKNYFEMLSRWVVVTTGRFLGLNGPRPLLVLLWPLFGFSLHYGFQALTITEGSNTAKNEKVSDPRENLALRLIRSLRVKYHR